MKAISLHQPWASMIATGEKTIETRSWPPYHWGEILIVSTRRAYPQNPKLPLGQALCIVDIVDFRPMRPEDEAAAGCPWREGLFAWVLNNVRRLEPFPVVGHQRIYEVDIGPSELANRVHQPVFKTIENSQ